jgi:hypothetical protein
MLMAKFTLVYVNGEGSDRMSDLEIGMRRMWFGTDDEHEVNSRGLHALLCNAEHEM